MDYEFYGVCVSECPKALDIVCNYDIDRTSTDSEYYNQEAALRDCIEKSLIGEEDEFDGSKYNITDGSKWCSDAADNCWVLPLNTSSVLFRCVPEYDLNSNVNVREWFPAVRRRVSPFPHLSSPSPCHARPHAPTLPE